MAEITNQQAIRFCNDNARTLADAIETMDRTCQQFMLNIVRDWESVPEVTSAADGDTIGGQTDRNPRTKLNVGELKYAVEQILAAMATGDRRAVVHAWAVNGRPAY